MNLMEIKDGKLQGSQVVGASINYSPEFNAVDPNANLLRRLAESGNGKVLDPRPIGINPFAHGRLKTHQPRDLWEWLLKFAIILFTLDVAVRRVQIDRDEWLKATATLRRWIFFWHPQARPAEAEESLAALLARRNIVRSSTTARTGEPSPDLFRPVNAPSEPLPGSTSAAAVSEASQPATAASVATAPEPAQETQAGSTASRLLEAKRRAQKRRGG